MSKYNHMPRDSSNKYCSLKTCKHACYNRPGVSQGYENASENLLSEELEYFGQKRQAPVTENRNSVDHYSQSKSCLRLPCMLVAFAKGHTIVALIKETRPSGWISASPRHQLTIGPFPVEEAAASYQMTHADFICTDNHPSVQAAL